MLGKEKRLNLSSRRRKECRTTLISIVFQQLLTMFSIMFFGFLLIRSNVINSEGTRQISTILSLFVMPATMITSFNADFDAKRLKLLLWATLAAFLTISIRAAIAHVLLKKRIASINMPQFSRMLASSVYHWYSRRWAMRASFSCPATSWQTTSPSGLMANI